MNEVTRHGAEAFADSRLARCRKRGVRSSVEAVHEGDNLLPVGFALPVEILTCKLDTAFVRFGTRVAEEHLVELGDFEQELAEIDLRVVRVEVAHVVEVVHLIHHRILDGLVLVAKRIHGDTRHEVQVLVALVVKEVRAFALHEVDVRLAIERSDNLFVLFQEVSARLCHSLNLH